MYGLKPCRKGKLGIKTHLLAICIALALFFLPQVALATTGNWHWNLTQPPSGATITPSAWNDTYNQTIAGTVYDDSNSTVDAVYANVYDAGSLIYSDKIAANLTNGIYSWTIPNLILTNGTISVTAQAYNNSTGYYESSPASVGSFVYNYSSSGSSGGGGSSTTESSNTSTSAEISPASGGTVSLGDDVSLAIPAGALSGDSNVTVAVQVSSSPPTAPSGYEMLSSVYQFTVDSKDHYTFNQSVTLTFKFDTSELAAGATPAVYYYDDIADKWVSIGGTTSGDNITVTTDHFTQYAVMALNSQQSTTTTTTTVTLSDITGHWAEKYIDKLVAQGAITGYPNGTFKPDNQITRAEFATVLVRAFKLQHQSGKVFADTADHWAKDYIATAAANGIVGGYNTTTFGPDDLITREQMAAMIVRAAKLQATSNAKSFTDSEQISSWAKSAADAASSNNIINGYPDNTFRPKNNATRAEAATVIVKALKL